MQMPRMPNSAMRGRVAGFISCLRSHSPIVVITSLAQKSRTFFWAANCSSLSAKSMSPSDCSIFHFLLKSDKKCDQDLSDKAIRLLAKIADNERDYSGFDYWQVWAMALRATQDSLVTTYLEMTDPSEFQPDFLDATGGHSIMLMPMNRADVGFYRFLYNGVGEMWRWRDR